MTAHQSTIARTVRPAVWILTLLLTAMPLAGCMGGPSIDPELEAQQRELSQQTVDTSDGLDEGRAARAAAAARAETADMDDDETPASPEDPHPAEPAPTPGDTMADDSGRCGNGLLDDDEICEIGIAEGEEGSCPSECRSDECLDAHSCWTVCVPRTEGTDCD